MCANQNLDGQQFPVFPFPSPQNQTYRQRGCTDQDRFTINTTGHADTVWSVIELSNGMIASGSFDESIRHEYDH
jgi:hypothetical protein